MPPATPVSIDPVPLPDRVGVPESAAFEEMVTVMNGVAVDLWGNDDFVYSAEAELASYRTGDFHDKRVFVAVAASHHEYVCRDYMQ